MLIAPILFMLLQGSLAGSLVDKSIVLHHVNKYRELHNASAVTLDPILDGDAQYWAETIVEKQRFMHSPFGYGENLAKLGFHVGHGHKLLEFNFTQSALEAIDNWYSENTFFDFRNPKYNKTTERFTQLVWNASKNIGIGISSCDCAFNNATNTSDFYTQASSKRNTMILNKFILFLKWEDAFHFNFQNKNKTNGFLYPGPLNSKEPWQMLPWFLF